MIKRFFYDFYQRVLMLYTGTVPVGIKHNEKNEPLAEKQMHANRQEIKRYWR